MDKGSRYGRKKTEDAWRDAEADCLYRLFNAGVRVPTPYNFVDGVLIMELICDGNGAPAPRLVDLAWSPEDAESMLIYLVGRPGISASTRRPPGSRRGLPGEGLERHSRRRSIP